ncbi:hypothetical protein AMECASPLE_036876 [Ameca splendens]|uniref:Uncharacterized protein n=1 Tax=Ameca splendens TaxID=208324 RepID=A0ABV1A346_9TELE
MNKRHGFLGKLDTKDILKLQGDLKLEIMQTKSPDRKEQRKIEYKLSEKWLEQSKLRDMKRQEKGEKRQEKPAAAVLIRSDEETIVRRRPEPELPADHQQAAAAPQNKKVNEPVVIPKAPTGDQKSRNDSFKPEEKTASSWLSPQRVLSGWWNTGLQTMSQNNKGKVEGAPLYPTDQVGAHGKIFHPSGENLAEDAFPMVEVANPNPGTADNPQPATILVYRPWTQEDRSAALKGIPPIQEGVEEFLAAITELRGSLHLNGREMLQCFTQLFGHRWCRVVGDYTGCDAVGQPLDQGSQALQEALNPLFERI